MSPTSSPPPPEPSFESSGALAKQPLDLRLLVAADLAPGSTAAEGTRESLDSAALPHLFERLSPRLELRVPDRLGLGGRELTLSFAPTSLQSFRPDGVAAVVTPLADLVAARQLLTAARRGEIDPGQLAERLPEALRRSPVAGPLAERLAAGPAAEAETALPPGDAASPIDSLLQQVEVPAAGGGPSRLDGAALADVLAAAVAPAKRAPGETAALEAQIAEIDARLSRQVTAILEAPAFRRLEATWRGLAFLLERTDFRGPIRLEVLAASKEQLPEAFFSHVFSDEYEGTSAVPLAAVAADYSFDRSQADLEILQDVSRLGASLQVPFLTAADPAYFGLRQGALLATLPDLIQKCRGSEYAKWNRFRAEEGSLWVALTTNRFLLRPPWEPRDAPPFAWPGGGPPSWGSGVWALAAVLLAAFREHGLRLPMAGRKAAELLGELPTQALRRKSGDEVAFPLEVLLPEQRSLELAECGFSPLTASPGSDAAYFATAPTFHSPSRYHQEEATRDSFRTASLPYRIFAALASHFFDRTARDLAAELPPEQVAAACRRRLLAFLAHGEEAPEPDEVEVEVQPDPEAPQGLQVVARLRPRFQVYGGEADLVLGTTIGAGR